MNNSFSISRFALLLKKDFTENIRLYAIGSVSLLFGLATLMVLGSPLICLPAEEGGAIFATFPIYYLFCLSLCIAASMMFPQFRTKQGRLSVFMLPATNAEKYAEQIFTNIFCFALMFVACVIAAEGIRMVVAPWVWGDVEASFVVNLGSYVDHFAISIPKEAVAFAQAFAELGITPGLFIGVIVAGNLCSLGVFTLGAMLWPKYSFIKTYVAIYILQIAFSILGVIAASIFSSFDWTQYFSTRGLFIGLIVALGVGAVVAFVASYIVFTHKKVIS